MKTDKTETKIIKELTEIYQNFVVELRQIESNRDKKINKIIKDEDNNKANEILKIIKKQN